MHLSSAMMRGFSTELQKLAEGPLPTRKPLLPEIPDPTSRASVERAKATKNGPGNVVAARIQRRAAKAAARPNIDMTRKAAPAAPALTKAPSRLAGIGGKLKSVGKGVGVGAVGLGIGGTMLAHHVATTPDPQQRY